MNTKDTITINKSDILEIVDKLVYSLGDISPQEADRIVRDQANRLMNDVLGIAGSVRQTNYICIQYHNNTNKGGAVYQFVIKE